MRLFPLLLTTAMLIAAEGGAPPEHAGPPGQRPPGPPPEEIFKRADADKDGKVTLAELTAAVEGHQAKMKDDMFAKMDANGDGQISKAEFAAFEPPAPPGDEGKGRKKRGPDPAEMMKRLDKNNDGAITQDELPKGREGKGGKDGKPPREGGGDELLPDVPK